MLEAFLMAGGKKLTYSDSGPGPITATGDSNVAFFGEVASSLLFSSAELVSQIPELGSSTALTANDNTTWLKFYYYGKILFIKKIPLFSNAAAYLSWGKMYGWGLIHGEDGPGQTNNGNPTTQLRFVNKGGYRYKVRTITGDNTPVPTETVSSQALDTTVRSSMYTELLYRMCVDSFTGYAGAKWGSYLYSDLSNGSELCREMLQNSTYPAGIVLFRGAVTTANPRLSQYQFSTNQPQTYSSLWRPVLEYVPMSALFTIRDFSVQPSGFLNGPVSGVTATVPDTSSDPNTLQRLSNFTFSNVNRSPVSNVQSGFDSNILSRIQTAYPTNANQVSASNVTSAFHP
jgi:hypothetical protein